MALKSFGRGGDPGGPGASIPTPSPAPSGSVNSGGLTAFIDQGSEFEGKLSFRDTVRIDGRFRGEIQASIRSNTIAISGSVEGDVSGGQKVVLHKTARVNGNVETSCLVIEDGAILNGQVKMTSPDAKPGAGSLKAISGGAPKPDAPEGGKD